jgi:hypothetical protein
MSATSAQGALKPAEWVGAFSDPEPYLGKLPQPRSEVQLKYRSKAGTGYILPG